MAAQIIAGAELQDFMRRLQGLYKLGDYYSWDSFLKEVLPREPDWREGQDIARSLFDWTEDPELSQEIRDAKLAIDFDSQDRPPMFKKQST